MKHLIKKLSVLTTIGMLVLGVGTPAFASDLGMHTGNVSDENNNILTNQQFFGNKLFAVMTGGQEVPGPGDPDSFGITSIKIQQASDKLCVNMHVFNIDPATAAHVHQGARGVAGPIVVTLPTPDADGLANGCVDVASDTLKAIKENPSNYYVNVHNAAFPNGAVRGQLFSL